MKRIFFIITLFILVNSYIFAFHPYSCDPGKIGPDAGQALLAVGKSALYMAIPLININYSMHEEGRDYLIYITDGLYVASLSYIMIDKLVNPSNYNMWYSEWPYYSGETILIGIGLLTFAYSLWDLLDGVSLNDGGRVSRAGWSVALIPIGSLFSWISMRTIYCRPSAYGVIQYIYPAIGPDYAGLDCKFTF